MSFVSCMMRGTALAAALALGACAEDYYNRTDTVSFGAGDAREVNRVAHMIDPWPHHSANPAMTFDGVRMAGAMDRYETGETTKTETETTSNVAK